MTVRFIILDFKIEREDHSVAGEAAQPLHISVIPFGSSEHEPCNGGA
jgi:hypothetical protein